MSDNVHAFSGLGDLVILAVKYLPFDEIPQFCKRADDDSESSPAVMTEKAFDVFKDEVLRPLGGQDSCDIKEQSSSRVFKSKSLAADAECLTWESADEELKVGKAFGLKGCNVSEVAMSREAPFVSGDRVLVNLAISDALRQKGKGLSCLLNP